MIYEEALNEADKKLSKWHKISSFNIAEWQFEEDGYFIGFIISCYPDGGFSSCTFSVEIEENIDTGTYKWETVLELEDIFTNPLSITPEEASLFKLEHGFDYPKEFVNDL